MAITNRDVQLAYWKERIFRKLRPARKRGRSSSNAVWLPSFLALGAADAASASRSLSRAVPGIEALGGLGGVGLLYASARDLRDAESADQRLDASSDLAWGAQGMLYLSASKVAGKVALALGLTGALIQTTVGVRRIREGVRSGDKEMVRLGALDLGGGLVWLGWDVAGWGQPWYVASYMALMVGREAYANREALRRLASRIMERTQRAPIALLGPYVPEAAVGS